MATTLDPGHNEIISSALRHFLRALIVNMNCLRVLFSNFHWMFSKFDCTLYVCTILSNIIIFKAQIFIVYLNCLVPPPHCVSIVRARVHMQLFTVRQADILHKICNARLISLVINGNMNKPVHSLRSVSAQTSILQTIICLNCDQIIPGVIYEANWIANNLTRYFLWFQFIP